MPRSAKNVYVTHAHNLLAITKLSEEEQHLVKSIANEIQSASGGEKKQKRTRKMKAAKKTASAGKAKKATTTPPVPKVKPKFKRPQQAVDPDDAEGSESDE